MSILLNNSPILILALPLLAAFLIPLISIYYFVSRKSNNGWS